MVSARFNPVKGLTERIYIFSWFNFFADYPGRSLSHKECYDPRPLGSGGRPTTQNRSLAVAARKAIRSEFQRWHVPDSQNSRLRRGSQGRTAAKK